MYKKHCPTCHQSSYSSCDTGTWICPNCNQDLTRIRVRDAESLHQSKPQLFIIKNSNLQQHPELDAKIRPYVFQTFD